MARDFGDEMRLRLSDGVDATMRGAFSLSSSGVSVQSVTHQDGSIARVVTLRERTAEVTIEDGGQNLDDLLRADRQDLYLTEECTGVSHVFRDAFFSGDPRSDRATGGFTGLVIVATDYQRLG